MAIVILEGPKILAGESLSNGLDCSAGTIFKLTMPFTWTHADITFQTSSDGNGYNDILHTNGLEISSAVYPNTAVIGLGLVRGFLKIRSGSRDRPVIQTEDRTFAVAIDTGPEIGGGGSGQFTVRLEHHFGGS
jgi:hypothetical protein